MMVFVNHEGLMRTAHDVCMSFWFPYALGESQWVKPVCHSGVRSWLGSGWFYMCCRFFRAETLVNQLAFTDRAEWPKEFPIQPHQARHPRIAIGHRDGHHCGIARPNGLAAVAPNVCGESAGSSPSVVCLLVLVLVCCPLVQPFDSRSV